MPKRPFGFTSSADPGYRPFAWQAWLRARERIESRPRPNLLVHVSSYKQDRGGTATQVSEYTRNLPGQGGGGSSGGKVPPMGSPVGREPKFRGRDGYGYGHYGARRRRPDGTIAEHKGVDVVTTPGETIKSPVAGKVVDPHFDPYWRDSEKGGKLSAVWIETDDGHVVEVLYVDSEPAGLKRGDKVEIGTPIGTAQDISTVYLPTDKGPMTNHVDIRIKDKNGVYKDPTPHIRGRR